MVQLESPVSHVSLNRVGVWGSCVVNCSHHGTVHLQLQRIKLAFQGYWALRRLT